MFKFLAATFYRYDDTASVSEMYITDDAPSYWQEWATETGNSATMTIEKTLVGEDCEVRKYILVFDNEHDMVAFVLKWRV